MIASLQGLLKRKTPEGIVVETGGIGFDVIVSLPTLYELPDVGTRVEMIIHSHVRESQILLIGFLRSQEREAFRYLMTVNGIGPRLAVNILSGLPADELIPAILQKDAQRLQRIPGVGKKMAERIVVELSDKIPARDVLMGAGEERLAKRNTLFFEVLSALMNLGYKRKESEQAIDACLKKEKNPDTLKLEDLLKTSLRQLVKD